MICSILSLDVIVENFGNDVRFSNFTTHRHILILADEVHIGDIRIPAHFRSRAVNQSGVAGDGVVLMCEVDGDLPLRVAWSAAHRPLAPGHSRVMERHTPTGIVTELQLDDLARRDAGPYRCSAANDYGQDEMIIYLTVKGCATGVAPGFGDSLGWAMVVSLEFGVPSGWTMGVDLEFGWATGVTPEFGVSSGCATGVAPGFGDSLGWAMVVSLKFGVSSGWTMVVDLEFGWIMVVSMELGDSLGWAVAVDMQLGDSLGWTTGVSMELAPSHLWGREGEALYQGCSKNDILMERAGLGLHSPVGLSPRCFKLIPLRDWSFT
uniref:Ig-like domain-containing protein n=1 Tax=Timema shepardi TaxID=629360 RepID=A0A7R9FWL8_TIMSH|nr:unnamed protein product [Timema shepardi]